METMARICKVLVVEDDDGVRALLGDVLDHAGYEFTLVGGAAEMRAALALDEYDVAIIDVSLRGAEDGFALAEQASEKGCGVIMTTGDPQQRPRLEASRRHHLMKPFRIQDLTQLVDLVLKDTAAICRSRHGGSPDAHPISA
jgi:DNA-binding NtrC family response regulator